MNGILVIIGVVSVATNILGLTTIFFVLQVYDRVLSSHSIETLVVLGMLTAALLLANRLLLDFRRGILGRVADRFERQVEEKFLAAIAAGHFQAKGRDIEPWEELGRLKAFIGGNALISLFDLPFVLFFLLLMFLLHWLLGVVAVSFATAIGLLMILGEQSRRFVEQESGARSVSQRPDNLPPDLRFFCGGYGGYSQAWKGQRDTQRDETRTTRESGEWLRIIARYVNTLFSPTILGVAAIQVIGGELTIGIMMASSALSWRISNPLNAAILGWPSVDRARSARRKLRRFLQEQASAEAGARRAERPSQSLRAETLAVSPEAGGAPVLAGVSFALQKGDFLGVLGPTASGKSLLARTLVGISRAKSGALLLDNRYAPAQLPAYDRPVVGYLPQTPLLIEGTIAENITHFRPGSHEEAAVALAQRAGAHDHILRMPRGYGTALKRGGLALPAGLRQRIAVARAFYGRPFVVVLDDPIAHLDIDGVRCLNGLIDRHRQAGGIVVIFAHHPHQLLNAELVARIAEGRLTPVALRNGTFKRVGEDALEASEVEDISRGEEI